MWKIFRKDRYARIEQQKKLAERKRRKAREKAWNRQKRKKAWRAFKKRYNEFMANPFGKHDEKALQRQRRHAGDRRQAYYAKIDQQKLLVEKAHRESRQKAFRRKSRSEAWRAFRKRSTAFMTHPFARKKLSSSEREKLRLKRMYRHDRKIERQKWLAKFRKHPWRTIFPPAKQRVEGGGYLYVYNMTRQEKKALALKKRREAFRHFKLALTTSDIRTKLATTFLFSLANYLLAFLVIYVLYQVVTILIATSFHIPVIWYYYKLKFAISDFSPLYTRSALVVIFATSPIVSLMMAFLFLKLFFTKNLFLKRFKLFYLWGFICGSNMFFGAYIAGVITRTEFIFTTEWLFLSSVFDVEEIVFAVMSFISLLIIGWIVTPLFLVTSGSVKLLKPEFRLLFVVSQVLLPWMAGGAVLFLITLPDYYIPLVIKTITPLFMLLPSLFMYRAAKFDNIHKVGIVQHNYFRWSIIIAVLALLFFYRVILNFGLRFL
jgi:hypothetical protein